MENLLLEKIIDQDEYDKLKNFSLVNEGEKFLNMLNERRLSEQEQFYVRLQLLHVIVYQQVDESI